MDSRHVTHGEVPVALFARLDAEPVVAEAVLGVGAALRDRIDARAFELIALRCGAGRDCLYEWRGHCRLALAREEAELTEEEIAWIAVGPAAFHGRDRAILEAVDELIGHGCLSAERRTAVGDLELVLQVAVVFYHALAALLVGTPPDAEPVAGLETPAVAIRSLRRGWPA